MKATKNTIVYFQINAKISFQFHKCLQGWPTFVDQVWLNFLPSPGNLPELI